MLFIWYRQPTPSLQHSSDSLLVRSHIGDNIVGSYIYKFADWNVNCFLKV